MPITKDFAVALKVVSNAAVKDPSLLKLLVDEKTSGPTLAKYIKGLPGKLQAAGYTKVNFVRVEPSGFCIVAQPAGILTIVVVPSPLGIMQEMVGGWPTGSSPEQYPQPPGCRQGDYVIVVDEDKGKRKGKGKG